MRTARWSPTTRRLGCNSPPWERTSERARDLPDGRHLFVVGSSGVEYALADGWTDGSAAGDGVGGRDRIVVTSGSASPETAAQIDYATRHGFTGVRLDTRRLLDPDEADDAVEAAVSTAREALSEGSSPLLYTAKGSDDPAIAATTDHADSLGLSSETAGRRLGRGVGAALRRLLSETSLDRACVAGGDTCGHAVPELGVHALTTAAPLSPGAPLCEAHADADEFDGIEIALKGGQLGDERYFGRVRDGEPEQG